MTYKKKRTLLSVLVIILALANIFTMISGGDKNTAFAWLPPRLLDLADRIEIYGSEGNSVLIRVNNVWRFLKRTPGSSAETSAGTSAAALQFPVKRQRVEGLLRALSGKSAYQLRALSQEAASLLGFAGGSTGGGASRILVAGGAGRPLLDLLVGRADALGQDVYVKRADSREIYSGEDVYTYYTESPPRAWYDLALFGQGAFAFGGSVFRSGRIDAGMVQQADIVLPSKPAAAGGAEPDSPPPFTLRRAADGWRMDNESAAVDALKTEAWLRSVLEAEADGFAENPFTAGCGITLRLGDGTSLALEAGPPRDGSRPAMVSGSSLVYTISDWTINRLFRDKAYFLE